MSSSFTNNSNTTMIPDAKWQDLYERNEMAYFRGELAISSPQSYTIDEMREISDGMDAATAEAEAAMRADFQSMPVHAQAAMLDLLEKADPGNMAFWNRVLGIPEMPDEPPATA